MLRIFVSILMLAAGCSSNGIRAGGGDPSDAAPPPSIDVRVLEQEIHAVINEVRSEHTLEILMWDDDLAAIARAHSGDMASTGTFSHTGSGGTLPSDRSDAAGYECLKEAGDYRYTGIAENIFMTYVYRSHRTYHGPNGTRRTYDWKTQQEIARDVVNGWMDSPGHRANILQARHDREGIGIVRTGDQLFITQNLC